MEFYAVPLSEALRELKSSGKGLSSAEAQRRLAEYGPNELQERKKVSRIRIFLDQFSNVIVWILIAAAIVSVVLPVIEKGPGGLNFLDFVDFIIIMIIVVLNAFLGFIQEYRAERAIEALKRLASLRAKVLRDGKIAQLSVSELVPGDVILLETGDKVPADARLLEAVNLETLEAVLTGESTPVAKETSVLKTAPVAERRNMVFSSTIVTKGRAKALVAGTGMKTEVGRIAELIQEVKEEMTPLQRKLDDFGKAIAAAVVALCVVIFAVGTMLHEAGLFEMLLASISLAVAAIPEGLPAVITISLALGVQRMSRKNALVRKLPSVETLGSTTVICSDKTGTLTLNQMTVKKIFVDDALVEVAGEGYSASGSFSSKPKDLGLLLKTGALCNNAVLKDVAGDPTELAILASAGKLGLFREQLEKTEPRVDEIEFDSRRKLMTTVHQSGGRRVAYTKGAPDVLLGLCSRIVRNGKPVHITPSDRKRVLAANEQFANQALRVLGFACRELRPGEKPAEKDMTFVGLQAMIDPPRPEVKAAIDECRSAGIRVVMITGDHRSTALAVARELGMEGEAMTGEELDRAKDLDEVAKRVAVYARVSPEHKLKIIAALKKQGHVVAMTGDGINDAPALKKADIGVAMGITGTDVAKEASHMVLTDDNFTSIKNAVEEGRAIYDNIRKFIFFLLSSNFAEVMIVFFAIILGMPLPLIAIHLLWVNLVTDGLPALALSVDPADKGLMRRKPRRSDEHVLTQFTLLRLLWISLIITFGTLALFRIELGETDLVRARTMAFTTLMMFEMFNALNSRSEDRSVFSVGLFSNKYLLLAIASSILLQLMVMYTPLHVLFRIAELSFGEWLVVGAVSSSVLVLEELRKFLAVQLQKKGAPR